MSLKIAQKKKKLGLRGSLGEKNLFCKLHKRFSVGCKSGGGRNTTRGTVRDERVEDTSPTAENRRKGEAEPGEQAGKLFLRIRPLAREKLNKKGEEEGGGWRKGQAQRMMTRLGAGRGSGEGYILCGRGNEFLVTLRGNRAHDDLWKFQREQLGEAFESSRESGLLRGEGAKGAAKRRRGGELETH